MEIITKKLKGFYEIIPEKHNDNRGYLFRMYDKKVFSDLGLNTEWVQESNSYTKRKNTLRGLHIQLPNPETKLIRIITGKSQWVVVDLRKDSETFGQWDSAILLRTKNNMIYVEKGFANGCLSLSNNTNLSVFSSEYFNPYNNHAGIVWNDSDLNIKWGLENPIISERDKNYQSFREFINKYGRI